MTLTDRVTGCLVGITGLPADLVARVPGAKEIEALARRLVDRLP